MDSAVLQGISVLSLALNVPGPVAVARLRDLGARAEKVEPPDGDPLDRYEPRWYSQLHRDVRVARLDLRDEPGKHRLEALLSKADLLITSMRSGALERLGLRFPELASRYPGLCSVAIIGSRRDPDVPGHDLTFQASAGLVTPPRLPRVLAADLAGADRVVAAALALLLARERGFGVGTVDVSLEEAAEDLAVPLRLGLTERDGLLGGALPEYALYRAARGWIAVAALEDHLRVRLLSELGVDSAAEIGGRFREKAASWWESWGAERGLPIVALRGVGVP